MEPTPGDALGRVFVTFLGSNFVDLEARGMDERQAADLRYRLRAFVDDWDRPEMEVYDAI